MSFHGCWSGLGFEPLVPEACCVGFSVWLSRFTESLTAYIKCWEGNNGSNIGWGFLTVFSGGVLSLVGKLIRQINNFDRIFNYFLIDIFIDMVDL